MSYLRRHRLSSVCARFGIFLVILVLSVNLLLLLFAKSEHNVKSLQWSRSVAVPDNILVQEFTPEKIRALGGGGGGGDPFMTLCTLHLIYINYKF